MKKICLKCHFLKEIPAKMVFCNNCRQKFYEESQKSKLLQKSDKTSEISKETPPKIKVEFAKHF